MRAWAAWALAAAMGIAEGACAARGGHVAAPTGGSGASWRYEVSPTEDAAELRVDAWLPSGSLADLVVRHGSERFVSDVDVEGEDGWRDIRRAGGVFRAPECARGCHVRYRFLLRASAERLRDLDMASAWEGVIEASPSLWLLHPALAPTGTRYRFHVRRPLGLTFVTGVTATADGPPDTYEADASSLGTAPYAAFGALRTRHVEAVSGATIDLAIAPASYGATDDAIVAWAARSARTIGRFLGCFPLERVMLLIVPARGNTVRRGETMGDGGASIVVELGEEATEATLENDWVLPHEMAHLALPNVPRRHHWIEEGVAVYVQPIARARSGELSPVDVWREFALGMPKGASARDGQGLDGARDWARTYWGGAAFCLLADVEIRRRTGNRLGFEDALRGIEASGGSVAQMWDFDRLLQTADASVGAPVLGPMHDRMVHENWSVDLPGLFRDLGVALQGNAVTLVDDAPLAAVRRAITEPLSPEAPEPTACRNAMPGRMAQR